MAAQSTFPAFRIHEGGARLERLSLDRERLGPVNLIAEQELTEIEAEREKSLAERDELAEAIARLRGSIGSLNREGRTRLLAARTAPLVVLAPLSCVAADLRDVVLHPKSDAISICIG